MEIGSNTKSWQNCAIFCDIIYSEEAGNDLKVPGSKISHCSHNKIIEINCFSFLKQLKTVTVQYVFDLLLLPTLLPYPRATTATIERIWQNHTRSYTYRSIFFITI